MYERVIAWLLSFMGSRDRHSVDTNQVLVGSTPVEVLQRNANRYGCVVTNTGSGTVFVGRADESLLQVGHALLSGNSLALIGATELWAVADASGPYVVSYIQEVTR